MLGLFFRATFSSIRAQEKRLRENVCRDDVLCAKHFVRPIIVRRRLSNFNIDRTTLCLDLRQLILSRIATEAASAPSLPVALITSCK